MSDVKIIVDFKRPFPGKKYFFGDATHIAKKGPEFATIMSGQPGDFKVDGLDCRVVARDTRFVVFQNCGPQSCGQEVWLP